ncbi:hypothetical protein QYM36_018861, partial [Artemia franciscana]
METKMFDFPLEEEKILDFWNKIKAFQTSLNQSKEKPSFIFWDGPPFANGVPHYGHILAGTIKDVVTRYAHQNGYHVERRFGWDCHGVPVEYEIDTILKIKSPQQVKNFGIKNYNDLCRESVMRYLHDWERIVTRLGRWIDFKNGYKTLDANFMESVWWVFKQLFQKGLVYKSCKVMPFSTSCSTTLSNFEAEQNYREITDPAVIVTFPLEEDPTTSLLAWTTTPWTLPCNMALCVNANSTYVKVLDLKTGAFHILMRPLLSSLYNQRYVHPQR